MKKIIQDYLEEKSGLLLLDIPTGMGKTYDVLEVMLDLLEKMDDTSRPVFFITNLKKNLPVLEFRHRAEKRGLSKKFDKYVIQLESMNDMVKKEFMNLQDKIPNDIKQQAAYKNLSNFLELLDTIKVATTDNRTVDQQIRSFEFEFRKLLIQKLDELGSVKTKLEILENDPSWEWVGKLYPCVFTRKRKIFFLSIDKYFLGNATLIEPNYQFINKKEWENAIIFMDEFDATKDSLMKQIIKKCAQNEVNLIELFTNIHHFLVNEEFQTVTLDEKGSEMITEFRRIFENIYQDYGKYSYKTVQSLDGHQYRSFLFNDGQYLQVKEKELFYFIDNKAKVNWITNKKDSQYIYLKNAFGRLMGAINYFINGMTHIVNVYKNSESSLKRGLTYSNCLSSILKVMKLSEGCYDYLYTRILEIQTEGKNQKFFNNQNLDVKNLYGKGFKLFSLLDGDDNALNTNIVFFQVPYFPEYYLYELASKNLVYGISATATVPSVLGNYDLEYLRLYLQEKFFILTDKQQAYLAEKFNQLTFGYNQVQIECIPIEKQSLENMLKKYLDEKIAQDFAKENKYPLKQYQVDRFIKMLEAIILFLQDKKLQSMLVLSNQLINDSKEIQISMFKKVIQLFNDYGYFKDIKIEELFVSIDSQNFNQNKQELIKKLAAGEKIVVFSSYKTIGIGQNLQYEIPKNKKVIQVNKRVSDNKDFDCMYLDCPRNIIVRKLEETISTESIYRGIFQMEYLAMTGEISHRQAQKYISEYFGNGKIYLENNELRSMNNQVISILQQAVGRICRTSNKNQVIKLFVDDEIFQKFDFSDFSQKLNNPEFQVILNANRNPNKLKKSKNEYLQNQAESFSLRLNDNLHKFLYTKENWEVKHIEIWQQMRQQVLKYPTLSEKQYSQLQGNFQSLYIKLPRPMNHYWFTQENDFKTLKIVFDGKGKSQVSSQEVKLNRIQKNLELATYFEKHQYALDFKNNDYILSPVAFQNIYKGALGEVIGKWMLKNYLEFPIEELPTEHYEKFDCHIQHQVYIDFKYWKESNKQVAVDYVSKIQEKLLSVNGKRAIIINIFADQTYSRSISCQGNIVEIPYLYLQNNLDYDMIKNLKWLISEVLK